MVFFILSLEITIDWREKIHVQQKTNMLNEY